VALLDKVGEEVRKALGMSLEELPLVKILEAGRGFLVLPIGIRTCGLLNAILGTWKAGREIAAKLRPDTKGPPIEIISDGTLF
jgi:hypothetical protein